MGATLQALRAVPLFAGLSEGTLRRLAGAAIRRTYNAGETVIVEGEPCQAAFFVAEGQVRVVRFSHAGREQVLAEMGPGGGINTVPPFLPGGVNHATVRAITPATLYAFPAAALVRLVGDCPDLALALLHDFAMRLDRLTDLASDLSLYSVRSRLARFLLEQAEAGVVARCWTQDEIAARLGTVRDVVGRTLRAFADEGLLRMERQRILLLDRERLEMEAEG